MENSIVENILNITDRDLQIEKVSEFIRRRRRQILVHSYIYYDLNKNLIDDYTYSKWSTELVEIQNLFPEISTSIDFYEDFKGFDASTGFNLNYRQDWVFRVAHRLLSIEKPTKQKRKKNGV